MGQIIKNGAATSKVVGDVRATLARANARGTEMLGDAQRYLEAVDVRARELDEAIETTGADIVHARAELKEMDLRSNDLIGRVRDQLWNQIGRPAHDPVFGESFPGGTQKHVKVIPRRKAASLELLASMLETHRHRLIDDALLAEVTAELREQAHRMREVWERYDPMLTKLDLLRAQRTSNGRRAQRKLAALKKFWQGEGVSEHDIHVMIPNRKAARPAEAPAAADGADLEEVDDLLEVVELDDEDAYVDEDPADLAAK